MMFRSEKPDENNKPPETQNKSQAIPGVYPGAVADPTSKQTFLIIQRGTDGSVKTHVCNTDEEAIRYLEALLLDNVPQELIELYRAAKTEFKVHYRPVVDLHL